MFTQILQKMLAKVQNRSYLVTLLAEEEMGNNAGSLSFCGVQADLSK